MQDRIQFIHTADLHLGAPLNCGGEPPSRLRSLFNEAGYRVFTELVSRALEYGVDFVLIAGDVYDREARSVRAARFFFEQCARLSEEDIPVYVISGNHDPGGEKREPFSLPDNVHVFSCDEVEEMEYSDEEGRILARVVGQSYRRKFENRKMYTYYTPDGDTFNIGLLHSQLDPRNSRYVPVSAGELQEKEDIDYWALGHIHEPRLIFSGDSHALYPGTPQGRDIDEKGVRGCFLIEADRYGEVETEFLPLSPVIFKEIEVDISAIEGGKPENISHLEEILHTEAEALLEEDIQDRQFSGENNILRVERSGETNGGKSSQIKFPEIFQGYIVRWKIRGRAPVHEIIKENREETVSGLIKTLNHLFVERDPFLWTHSLVLQTGEELPDVEALRENNEVFREIDDLVEEILSEGEVEKELVESWGEIWQGSSDHEEKEPQKFYPDQETKKEIILEARRRIIEELYRREEQE
ncbi:MAG: metallophosphoesterase family protein [Bacillota bacterium]